MTRFFSITAIIAVTALAKPAAQAAPPHTGIQGRSVAELHPTPVEIAPGVWVIATGWASAPVAASISVVSARTGREVAQIATEGGRGNYMVNLPPGRYVLVPAPVSLGPDCFVATRPVEVIVRPRQFVNVDVVYRTIDPCAASYFSFPAFPSTDP
jgi:hypothetical protein